MIAITERPGFVVAELGGEHDVAGWAPVGGGLGRASRVVWHGVRNEDLPEGVDAEGLLRARLLEAGLGDAVAMMTSRSPLAYHRADAVRDGVSASAIVTAGMSNALRVGDPAGWGPAAGTINVLCRVSVPLTRPAQLEALSIAVEARTAAVLAHGMTSIRTGAIATGTGTDCVTIASVAGEGGAAHARYAGKHTAVGEVVGRATLEATRAALVKWVDEHPARVARAAEEASR